MKNAKRFLSLLTALLLCMSMLMLPASAADDSKMLAEVKKVAPTLFFNAGASCVNTGHCPEGEMTCGKFAEMIKLREKD